MNGTVGDESYQTVDDVNLGGVQTTLSFNNILSGYGAQTRIADLI